MAVFDDVAVATTTITVLHPDIDLSFQSTATNIQAGDIVTFTEQVTNTGEVPLVNIAISSDHGTPDDSTDDNLCLLAELDVGQSESCPLQIVAPTTTTTYRAEVTALTDAGLPLPDYELTSQAAITITVKPVDVPPDNNQSKLYLPVLVR